MEQAKVDVAYSNTNVKLIGISGGISYGALGMTHHSAQDIAAFAAIPNMRVYLPSDRFQTKALMEALLKDNKPAYIRWAETLWMMSMKRGMYPLKWTVRRCFAKELILRLSPVARW